MKRSVLASLAFALVLSAAPSVALADEGDHTDTAAVNPDPGITALHKAVDDMKAAKLALATDCPNQSTAKCKAAAKDLRASFKEARSAAIGMHHAFKQEQKKARDEAKAKAKTALKPATTTPLPTPRG